MIRIISIVLLSLAVAGCSLAQKKSKTATSPITDSFSSSTKKVSQDFTQTEADVGKVESEIKIPR